MGRQNIRIVLDNVKGKWRKTGDRRQETGGRRQEAGNRVLQGSAMYSVITECIRIDTIRSLISNS